MTQGFIAHLRTQQEWGWLLSIWLFLSGSSAGLFLAATLFGLPLAMAWLALGLIGAGGLVLLLEQGSPRRAWRAVSRPGTSWLSRGVLFVTLFVVTGVLYVAPSALPGLPWRVDGALGRALGYAAALCALMIVIYPGLFLANNRSIPFWNTWLLPAVLAVHAALGAAALVLVAAPYLALDAGRVAAVAAGLVVLAAVAAGGYLAAMYRAGGVAAESVRVMNRAPVRWYFQGGTVLAGTVVPLLLLLLAPAAAWLAGLGMLAGSWLFRYSVLRAGVFVPPALVQDGVDFSHLNRTGDELRREYAGVLAPTGGPGG